MAEYEELLLAARYDTKKGSKYPFYLIQLSSEGELPLRDALVSDALVEMIKSSEVPYSHVFLQTHGWNTPPDKAIRVPFNEFIGGMQDDPNMPDDDSFNPLFVAFTWQALPLRFMQEEDALKRSELLEESLNECEIEDPPLVNASREIRRAAENRDTKSEELKGGLRALKDEVSDDEDEGAMDVIDNDDEEEEEEEPAPEEDGAEVADRSFNFRLPSKFVIKVLDPFQKLVFGRLISRGRKTGRSMQDIIAKFMLAQPDPTVKYCLMANSLGAHVVSGALMSPSVLPYKLHTAFIVQGAANNEWYSEGGKYESVRENVAGPIVCTVSEKDHLLKRVFGPFHGDAVGSKGFPRGVTLEMRSRDDLAEQKYEWCGGEWNSVEGTRFIDEGNAFVGGHGDFKEDETTMTYWSAINMELDRSKYLTERSPEVVAGNEEPEAAPEPAKEESGGGCVVV